MIGLVAGNVALVDIIAARPIRTCRQIKDIDEGFIKNLPSIYHTSLGSKYWEEICGGLGSFSSIIKLNLITIKYISALTSIEINTF